MNELIKNLIKFFGLVYIAFEAIYRIKNLMGEFNDETTVLQASPILLAVIAVAVVAIAAYYFLSELIDLLSFLLMPSNKKIKPTKEIEK